MRYVIEQITVRGAVLCDRTPTALLRFNNGPLLVVLSLTDNIRRQKTLGSRLRVSTSRWARGTRAYPFLLTAIVVTNV